MKNKKLFVKKPLIGFCGLAAVLLSFGLIFTGCDNSSSDTAPQTSTVNYTVSYDAGKGDGTAPPEITVPADTEITLPGPEGMTAPGDSKPFYGWSSNGQIYMEGESYTVNANTVFTAEWGYSIEGALRIDGTPEVGQTLRADTTGLRWDETGTLSYRWVVDGKIKGTDVSYTVTEEDFHKAISLTVTASENFGKIDAPATEPVLGVPFTALKDYLGALRTGSAESPNTVPLDAVNISEDWETINSDVKTAEKYVILDLTDCTATDNTIGSSQYIPVVSADSDNNFNIIKDNAFIKGIILPNSLTDIEGGAFDSCAYLTSVTIPDSLRSIGYFAFNGCTSLTSITIPNSVNSIGANAFAGCTSLRSVTIGNGVSSTGDNAFFGCTSLTSVIIKNGVGSIGQSAFSGCTSLTSVTIPDSIKSIGKYAFFGTSLTSVTIPDSVSSIGSYAFLGCTSLTSVTFEGSGTVVQDNSFTNDTSLRTAGAQANGQQEMSAGTYTLSGSTWTKQ